MASLLDFFTGSGNYGGQQLPNSPEAASQGYAPNLLDRFGAGLDRLQQYPGLPAMPMDEEERRRQRLLTIAQLGSTVARGGTLAEGLQGVQQQGLQRQLFQMQLAQMQQQQLREQALRQALAAQPTEAQRFQAGTAAMGAEGMGPTVTAARAQEKAVEAARPFASLTPEQRLIASQMPYAEAVKYIGENVKPEEYGTGTNTGMIGGRPVSYVVGKRGGIKVLDVAPQPNEEQIKTGNRILIRDKNTGKTVGTYDVEMSPAEVATNLRALRAQDLNDAKFAFEKQQTAQQNIFRERELGLRGREVDLSAFRAAQGDVDLVTDAAGRMFYTSKTMTQPTRQIVGPTIGDTMGQPLMGKGQTIPTAVTEEFVKNQANLNSIKEAYKLVEENPDAVGPLTGRTPAAIRDPFAPQKNIATRAAVARIGSMLIKDISGATVPLAEVPRLSPFIPLPTDDEKSIKVKLDGLEREIRNIEEERKKQYTAQGMNYPSLSGTIAIPGAPSIMNQYGLTPRR
jgi:hypothetical protein